MARHATQVAPHTPQAGAAAALPWLGPWAGIAPPVDPLALARAWQDWAGTVMACSGGWLARAQRQGAQAAAACIDTWTRAALEFDHAQGPGQRLAVAVHALEHQGLLALQCWADGLHQLCDAEASWLCQAPWTGADAQATPGTAQGSVVPD